MTTVSNAEAFRFLSNVKRQSAPPRCHPFTIVLQVLALGMVFIGLTMTIIAHWPGASTIGENPLKIAGPVLLAVGFVLFLIGMIVICCLNRSERTKWRKLVQHHIESRNQSQANRSADKSFDIRGNDKPGPSTGPSTGPENPYNPQVRPGNGSDFGFPQNDKYVNISDIQDPNQDPSQSFDGDNVDDIAEPKRKQKKRRVANPPPGPGGYSDTSTDVPIGDTSLNTLITTTTTTTTTVTKRTGDDGKTTEEKATSSTTKKTRQDVPKGGYGYDGRQEIQPTPSPGESRMLRVHVKAQPGASVHIHPTGSPSVKPKKAFSPSNTSGETDI